MPAARHIGTEGLVDQAPVSRFQMRVIALCSLATFLDGYDVQALGLAIPRMAADFGVAPTAFAFALAASLVGMAVGAMLLGPLADRFGRRPMLIAMMALVGSTTLGAMLAPDPTALSIWRVFTGLGLGATVPVAIAMTSEYAPARRRAALVTLMVCCTALGSMSAGFVAPMVEALWGWRGIFAVGAVLPLAMAVLLWAALPESLRFLDARGLRPGEIARQLQRIVPGHSGSLALANETARAARASLGSLFAARYRRRTLLLSVMFWFNLFANYALISWLPTLLGSAGWERSTAQRATGLVALGGIGGGLLLAWLADRGHSVVALSGAFVVTAALLYGLNAGPSSVNAWLPLLVLIGAGAFGGQMALGSVSAVYYPPALRSTGVGWSGGVGRVGAIFGPLALAHLMQAGMAPSATLAVLMIPMLVCAIGVLLLPAALRDRP